MIDSTKQVLQRLSQRATLTTDELQTLLNQPEVIPHTQTLTEKITLFSSLAPEVTQVCQNQGFTEHDKILALLWELWIPLCFYWIDQRQQLKRPLIQGILGLQGTGKTTLGMISNLILIHLGYKSLSLSLDDLYKTHAERSQIKQQNPQLIWRGPPGTHDINLGVEILNNFLKNDPNTPVLVPEFDKSLHNGEGDRRGFKSVEPVDIILFEGWFVGVNPINDEAFNHPPSPIDTPSDRLFAIQTNHLLKEYLPLWEKIDKLMVIYPKDYHWSKQWRIQAEEKMKAKGKSGMTNAQVSDFVDYFWKAIHPELFITPMVNNHSQKVDLIIEIERDHTPGNIKVQQ